MAASLKRKGSPSLEDDAESSKRRFAATEDPETLNEGTGDVDPPSTAIAEDVATTTAGLSPSPIKAVTSADPTNRAARFAALRARNQSSRKENLKDTKAEAKRLSTDPSQLTALSRKKNIAEHKLLQASTEAAGEDFERKRAWDWTVEEAEAWDARLEKKEVARQGVAFQSYAAEAGKIYERQIMGLEKAGLEDRKAEYERSKRQAVDRAVQSGGLEIVETETGELIAVDKDGAFYSTADSTNFVDNKPDRAAVDRLVEDIRKAEEVRLKKRRDRGQGDDSGDVTFINEKNKQFNQKLARFYNKAAIAANVQLAVHDRTPQLGQWEREDDCEKDMAGHEALRLVEILEKILLELPIRNVFAMQRVCRLWRATIAQSYTLQVALFHRPPQQDPQAGSHISQYAFEFAMAEHSAAKVISSISTLDGPFVVNPLLELMCDISTLKTPIGPRTNEMLSNPRHYLIQIALVLNATSACMAAQAASFGSWRNTQLFSSRSPSGNKLAYTLMYGGTDSMPAAVLRGVAPTMGELVDNLQMLRRFRRHKQPAKARVGVHMEVHDEKEARLHGLKMD
ncbi:Pre-mRNA-splicing factor SYF2 [Oleoguttula sp. CCFEE 5521]